jgi:hypothetical protein
VELLIAKELRMFAFNAPVDEGILSVLVFVATTSVIVLLGTLDAIPPPTRYVTVSVVFDGAIP